MTYQNEHLLPGQLGYFFVALSFVSALLAGYAFLRANFAQPHFSWHQSWKKIGRIAFLLNIIAVIGIIATLYYVVSQHYFEYAYVWKHSDKSLPPEYILSCLWEGQEGSFTLWALWNAILGGVVMLKKGKWESGVLSVVSLAQLLLASMILGIYLGEFKIGNNPFILLRDSGMLNNAPAFFDAAGNIRPDYLTFITDGSGLNATLQNYWMVIHPPVLFLGFAAAIIPFSLAITGLMNKDHSWTKVALSWASFVGVTLGAGIMMGAAWAYESLNFGGYWAWDPVENASLVPWLILVAAIHTNLVYNHTGYALRTTYVLYLLSFLFVIYSTYLTRSGVLGDTSVHSFTGNDSTWQLLLFISAFLFPALFLYIKNRKNIPTIAKEESVYSREFWMFIASLVLLLSAFTIIGKTSMPIVNKLFNTKIAQPEDVLFSYNQVQIFVGILVGVLSALAQYWKYKNTTRQYFWQKMKWPLLLSVLSSLLVSLFGGIAYLKHGAGFLVAIHLAIFASIFAIIANVYYLIAVLKGRIKISGGSVAHLGFAMILLGVLLSSSKQEILSINHSFKMFEKTASEDPAENLTLFKGVSTDMGKYMVTYQSDSVSTRDNKKYFQIKMVNKDEKDSFYLYPYVLKNNKGMEGFGATPDAKHFWNKDIYAYVSAFQTAQNDTASFRNVALKEKDSAFFSNGIIVLNKVNVNQPNKRFPHVSQDQMLMTLDMTVIVKDGQRINIEPSVLINQQQEIISVADTVNAQGLVVKFNKVASSKDKTLEIGIKESNAVIAFLTLKVIQFPFIMILWGGIVIMCIGFILSTVQRSRKKAN